MRYHQLINEAYVNVHTQEMKAKYADEVFDLIDKAYAYVGGHVNYPTPEALVNSKGWWKLIRRSGKIVAAAVMVSKHGQKRIASATDGSREAKVELMKLIAEDIRVQRGWSEVSGAAANFMIKLGLPPVPNTEAATLLDKEILALHGNFKYDRLLGGMVHTKMIVGFPNGQRYEISGEFDPSEVRF